jgi:chemosensory pili system protein ChpA (sensor histidine kinase/response regulator)
MSQQTLDLTALSWCLGEIRESLSRAESALEQQLQSDGEDGARLRAARTWLHQAHGALQIVDLEGVAVVTQESESLLDRVDRGELPLNGEVVSELSRAFAAIVEYLEGVLAGSGDSPVSLFPHYRGLLALREADRIEPADLYSPDLSVRPPRTPASEPLDERGTAAARSDFERGLLGFLRNARDLDALSAMHGAIERLHRAHQGSNQRTFWWLATAFFDALRVQALPVDLYAKRLVARINLQMRRTLTQGAPIADRMLRDLLFLLARTGSGSALADEARRLYRLNGTVPSDFETPRYGLVDPRALRQARDATALAKTGWEKYVRGSAQDLPAFASAAQQLDIAVTRLPWPGLQRLAGAMVGLRRALAAAGSGLAQVLSLEVATALLFVEQALERGARGISQHDRRAGEMAERLDRLCQRQESDGAAMPQWLTELSRAAQDRLTIAAFVGELQTNLRACEKSLDAFFREPTERAELPSLAPLLRQVSGALRLLGHAEAAEGAETVGRQVTAFAASTVPPETAACERVAQSLSALGFFVGSLHQADQQRGGFEFSRRDDTFIARLGEPAPLTVDETDDFAVPAADLPAAPVRTSAPIAAIEPFDISPPLPDPAEALPAAEAAFEVLGPVPEPAPDSQSLERLLDERRARVVSQLHALQDNPEAPWLRAVLRETLQAVHDEATLLDDADLRAHAADALGHLDANDGPPSDALVDAVSRVSGDLESEVPVLLPADDAVDDELLGIFLDEATEVLEAIDASCMRSRADAAESEHLTTIRRGFHTLKGSSRMVGLFDFGEAGWAMEQVCNGWLAEERPATHALHELITDAHREMSVWVERLRQDGGARIDPAPLVARAAVPLDTSVAADAADEPPAFGDDFFVDETIVVVDLPFSDDPVLEVDPIVQAEPAAEALSLPEAMPTLTETWTTSDETWLQQPSPAAADPSLEFAAPSVPGRDVDDPPMIDLAAFEAADPAAPRPDQFDSVFPSMPETGEDLIELTDVLDPADALEAFDPVAEPPEAAQASEAPESDEIRIGERLLSGQLYRIFLDEASELMTALEACRERWRDDLSLPASERGLRSAHTLAGSSRLVGLTTVHGTADALERFLLTQSISGRALAPRDLDDYTFVLGRLRASLDTFAAGREPGSDVVMGARAEALAERWAATGGDLAAVDTPPVTTPPVTGVVPTRPLVPAIQATTVGGPGLAPAVSPASPDPTLEGIAALTDEIDAELAPVFIEEADELLPRIGDALRAWQQALDDASLPASLMRLLHTVKGSARMAGAMRLGQLVHEMETRIESASALLRVPAALVEDLMARYDQALALYEAVRDPHSEAAQAGARAVLASFGVPAPDQRRTAQAPDALGEDDPAAGVAEVRPAVGAPAAPQHQLIRVRADILDRLVNEAGEVSIARARLDNELGVLRQSLGELSENVNRLRSQLREIELAADSQIQARHARSREVESDFDPLEFDRYTRFQELTRLLAESVSDVATVQQNAMRSLDEANRDLARQSQVTRDLQQDLMRIRMVQFGSIADRLYRVVRQAAKELDKRVNLELKGVNAELDRSVLERMAGPIEHLLRNAVSHGIESRADRLRAGKPETGEITLEVRQEGNEVILVSSDDGAGLNYAKIRSRAVERGLVDPSVHLGERELAQMIFMPGFSTATEVTALSGRGVGMDVVRAEVAAMGGRIELDSTPGRGTRFTVHLPVSLAVAQVVLLTVGTARVAVTAALIEQVLQLKPEVLASAYGAHHVEWQGEQVPLYFFGSMLELPGCTPLAQRYSPVVVLRSGTQRIALHVDHVAPSQEVVVKHVGPQLARLTGMAGATVLGNGEIVLILNPVQIAATGRGQQAGEGDTASFAPTQIEVAPTVMVVDDSVTVRKVTQRLLMREGYQVVLAKDGIDAMRQLQDTIPDVMLLDIEMPRMDGFELTRTMRGEERWRGIPIVMITSRTAEKHRNHALSLGVDVFLGKPFDEVELLRQVRVLAARKQPVA